MRNFLSLFFILITVCSEFTISWPQSQNLKMSFYFSAYQRTCNGQVGGAGVYKMHVGHLSQHYTEGSSDSEESLFFLCVYVFICTMTVQVPAETRGLDSLELELQAAVTHKAWILCKSSNCPKLLSHLSSP